MVHDGSGAVDSLGSESGFAKIFGHQTILEVGESRRLLVVALGEEHVPESQRLGLGLEVLKNLGVAFPSLVANANQGLEDSIGSCGSRRY